MALVCISLTIGDAAQLFMVSVGHPCRLGEMPIQALLLLNRVALPLISCMSSSDTALGVGPLSDRRAASALRRFPWLGGFRPRRRDPGAELAPVSCPCCCQVSPAESILHVVRDGGRSTRPRGRAVSPPPPETVLLCLPGPFVGNGPHGTGFAPGPSCCC